MRKYGPGIAKAVKEILDNPVPPGYVPTPPPVDPNDPTSQFVHDLCMDTMFPKPKPPVTMSSMALDALEEEFRQEASEKKKLEPQQ